MTEGDGASVGVDQCRVDAELGQPGKRHHRERLVGLEAAAAGVPAVAFATGGIPEWLHDGENGCLAPPRGASPALLAQAILRCVGTPDELRRLSDGARRSSAAWTLSRHVAGLDALFERVAPRAARSRAS